MESQLSQHVTLVETFELKVPVQEFTPIVTALMRRLEVEGVSSLMSMQFYTSDVPGEVGAVLRFSDPDHFDEHVKMISGWEDFKRFASMIRLVEIRIFGTIPASMEAWMRQFDGPIKKFETLAAGFSRPA